MPLSRFLLLIFACLPLTVHGWNLTYLSSYDSPNHELLDIEISGNFAYVPAGLGGLNIINISNPAAPNTVAHYSAYGCQYGRLYAWNVQGEHAYGSGRDCGIKVLDVSEPDNPIHVADYGIEGHSYEHTDGFYLADGDAYVFAAVHSDGVEIIDVTTPESPEFVASVRTENAWAVEVSEDGDFVYVADGAGGLKIIDVVIPKEPQLTGESKASGTAKDVAVAGNFVFVAVGAFGVDMFNVSNPYSPVLVANYNTTGYASRVAVSDSLVAVSDWDDVEILRWDDSPSLTLAGYKNTGGRAMAIHMIDDIVFSAEWRFFRTFEYGNIQKADIDVSYRNIDFPYTNIGECRDTTFFIANNGHSPLYLENITVDHDDFTVSLPVEAIQPGDSIRGMIEYCPTPQEGRGEFVRLSIRSNDPDEPLVTVILEGNSLRGLDVGQDAPDFTLSAVNRTGDVTLSELRGRVVVIAFFASW